MKLKVISLILALIALGLVSLTGVSLAQAAEMGQIGDVAHNQPAKNDYHLVHPFGNMDNAPVGIIFHHWQGFALKGDQSYVLRVSIESVRPVGPVNVRKLLASNMTLDEVRKEILVEEGNATFRGHLRLGECTYLLTNVEVKPLKGNITLSSDLMEPLRNTAVDNSTETVGRITVNTTSYEGELKGQGKLIITGGQLIGSYQVLLDMLH
jgi:hypothetical protein